MTHSVDNFTVRRPIGDWPLENQRSLFGRVHSNGTIREQGRRHSISLVSTHITITATCAKQNAQISLTKPEKRNRKTFTDETANNNNHRTPLFQCTLPFKVCSAASEYYQQMAPGRKLLKKRRETGTRRKRT